MNVTDSLCGYGVLLLIIIVMMLITNPVADAEIKKANERRERK